jgi:hypothetical protein
MGSFAQTQARLAALQRDTRALFERLLGG